MSAYEMWCRTKFKLVEEPDSEYLQGVEQTLRPQALPDLLAMFAGELYDRYDEVTREPTQAEVDHLLTNLDLLRAPSTAELDKMRADLVWAVDSCLQGMERMNYTGEHTHFEVLADARVLLAAVLAGKPVPQLERFRCPSLYKVNKSVTVRCQKQLPHGEEHTYDQGSGDHLQWLDKQSLNPPVPYDAPLSEAQIGMADAVAEQATRCGDAQHLEGTSSTVYCFLPVGHTELHTSASGRNWVSEATIREAEAIAEEQNRCDSRWGELHCDKYTGHEAFHTSDEVSWPTAHATCSAQPPEGQPIYCGRSPGHKGMHSSATGGTWPQ